MYILDWSVEHIAWATRDFTALQTKQTKSRMAWNITSIASSSSEFAMTLEITISNIFGKVCHLRQSVQVYVLNRYSSWDLLNLNARKLATRHSFRQKTNIEAIGKVLIVLSQKTSNFNLPHVGMIWTLSTTALLQQNISGIFRLSFLHLPWFAWMIWSSFPALNASQVLFGNDWGRQTSFECRTCGTSTGVTKKNHSNHCMLWSLWTFTQTQTYRNSTYQTSDFCPNDAGFWVMFGWFLGYFLWQHQG